MKKDYTIWVVIVGIVAAYFLSKLLNTSSPATNVNLDSQRGSFGTDTGLYGSAIAAQTASGTTG